jgi:phosphatidylglycerophosphate synthase
VSPLDLGFTCSRRTKRMIDNVVRPLLERLHRPMATALSSRVHPHAISLVGFLLGLGCAAALLDRRYGLAFVLWVLNRSADGLDGTLARVSASQSDFGGYLDIILDFVIYAAIPIALVFGLPEELAARSFLPLALLLASFYVNSASWMYPAALLEKRGHAGHLSTSIVMPSGLIEATETMVLYCLLILLPGSAPELMSVMTALVLFTAVQRLYWGFSHLRS